MKKKKEAYRRDRQTISKSGQEQTLPTQLSQLETGQDGNVLLRICLCRPTTFQGYGIEWSRHIEKTVLLYVPVC